MPVRVQAEHAHLAELERDAAGAAQIAAALREDRAHRSNRARRVVGRAFDDDGDAVRRVTFVDDLLVVGGVLAGRALDRRLDLVLRHVDLSGVLHGAAQRGVRVRVGAAGLDGHDDFLGNARELLGHAVPARKHRVLSNFEDTSHGHKVWQMTGAPAMRRAHLVARFDAGGVATLDELVPLGTTRAVGRRAAGARARGVGAAAVRESSRHRPRRRQRARRARCARRRAPRVVAGARIGEARVRRHAREQTRQARSRSLRDASRRPPRCIWLGLDAGARAARRVGRARAAVDRRCELALSRLARGGGARRWRGSTSKAPSCAARGSSSFIAVTMRGMPRVRPRMRSRSSRAMSSSAWLDGQAQRSPRISECHDRRARRRARCAVRFHGCRRARC